MLHVDIAVQNKINFNKSSWTLKFLFVYLCVRLKKRVRDNNRHFMHISKSKNVCVSVRVCVFVCVCDLTYFF